MRARNKTIGALGAALGLAMVVTMAVAPASARPTAPAPEPITATLSCASFEGLSVFAPSVYRTGVGMRANETISVTVTPALAADNIFLDVSTGSVWDFRSGSATSSFAFTSTSGGVYNPYWAYMVGSTTSTVARTWKFDCSSTTVAAPIVEPTPTPTPTPTTAPTKRHGKPRP
jgi:hypothetical protein